MVLGFFLTSFQSVFKLEQIMSVQLLEIVAVCLKRLQLIPTKELLRSKKKKKNVPHLIPREENRKECRQP